MRAQLEHDQDSKEGRWGALLYRQLAGVVHATLSAITQNIVVFEDPSGTHDLLAGHTGELAAARMSVHTTLLCSSAAFERQIAGHGWDPEPWQHWRQHRLHTHKGQI